MLVLSRKSREAILIDGSITVQILEVRGKNVRLGISAPKDVPIVRHERLVADLSEFRQTLKSKREPVPCG